jgi:hypothetical protein
MKICNKKVKLSLCLFDSAHLEDVWGSEGIAPPFLSCKLDGGD